MFWESVVVDLVEPGENIEFYRKGILNLTKWGAEANTTKREFIGDWNDISFDI